MCLFDPRSCTRCVTSVILSLCITEGVDASRACLPSNDRSNPVLRREITHSRCTSRRWQPNQTLQHVPRRWRHCLITSGSCWTRSRIPGGVWSTRTRPSRKRSQQKTPLITLTTRTTWCSSPARSMRSTCPTCLDPTVSAAAPPRAICRLQDQSMLCVHRMMVRETDVPSVDLTRGCAIYALLLLLRTAACSLVCVCVCVRVCTCLCYHVFSTGLSFTGSLVHNLDQ